MEVGGGDEGSGDEESADEGKHGHHNYSYTYV